MKGREFPKLGSYERYEEKLNKLFDRFFKGEIEAERFARLKRAYEHALEKTYLSMFDEEKQ